MALTPRNTKREKGKLKLTRDNRRDRARLSLTRDNRPTPGKNSRTVTKTPRATREINIPWRRIGGFFSSAGIICFLVLFVAAVSYTLIYSYASATTSSYFTLKVVEIQGNSRITSKEILEIAQLADGANSLNVSLRNIEEAMSQSPWVKDVSVKRVLPDKLQIGITEKEPVFWRLRDEVLFYADAQGNVIAPVKPGKFASLPSLEVDEGAEQATSALPDLVTSLQESRLPLRMTSVSWVRLSAARVVEVYMKDSHLKLTIGLEDWLPNLKRLSKTLSDLGSKGELSQVREIKAQGSNVWVVKSPPPAVQS